MSLCISVVSLAGRILLLCAYIVRWAAVRASLILQVTEIAHMHILKWIKFISVIWQEFALNNRIEYHIPILIDLLLILRNMTRDDEILRKISSQQKDGLGSSTLHEHANIGVFRLLSFPLNLTGSRVQGVDQEVANFIAQTAGKTPVIDEATNARLRWMIHKRVLVGKPNCAFRVHNHF